MVLLIVPEEEFRKQHVEVNPQDLGLQPRQMLGHPVLVAVWDDDRDDLAHGKFELAKTISMLELRLEIVQEEGFDGIYITNDGMIWNDTDIVRDLDRLRLHPELEYSQKCLDALSWVQDHAEIHDL